MTNESKPPRRGRPQRKPTQQQSAQHAAPPPKNTAQTRGRVLDITALVASLTAIVSIVADVASVIQGTQTEPRFYFLVSFAIIWIAVLIRALSPPYPLWATTGSIYSPVLVSLGIGLYRLYNLDIDGVTFLALGGSILIACIGVALSRQRRGIFRRGSLAYRPIVRRTSVIMLIAITVVSIVGFLWSNSELTFRSNTLLVLVADFDSGQGETENLGLGPIIRSKMTDALSKYDDIRVETLGRAIRESEGSLVAREEGKNRQATIVIWGWYRGPADKIFISTFFELIRQSGPPVISSCKFAEEKPTDEFYKLTFQGNMAEQMAAFSIITSAAAKMADGQLGQAIDRFEAALTYHTTYERDISTWLAIAYYLQANVLYGESDEKAIPMMTRAIQLEPNFVEAYAKRGSGYAYNGESDLAINDLNYAIQNSPTTCAYYYRAMAHRKKQQYDLAETDLKASIATRSDNADAYNEFGNLYSTKGDYRKALEQYSRAIKYNGQKAEFYINRASINNALGEKEAFKKDLEMAKLLTNDPKLRRTIDDLSGGFRVIETITISPIPVQSNP
jgi:tetratricopeptide (TPR) repeat protein